MRRPRSPPVALADILNDGTLDELAGRFGLLRLTARLIAARRPISDRIALWPMLGLTEEQHARILAA